MDSVTSVCQKIQNVLIDVAQASSHKIIERSRKVSGSNLCQTLVLGWLQNPTASLAQLTQVGVSVGLTITAQGLNERFNQRTASFLRDVFMRMVEHQVIGQSPQTSLLEQFTHIYLEDCSVITLPDELAEVWQGCGGNSSTSQSALKLSVRVDQKSGELDGPYLVDGREHDNRAATNHRPFQQGALYLRDLGYWKHDTFQEIDECGAYWLSYLKTSALIEIDGQWCKIDEFLLQQSSDKIERTIKLGKAHQLSVRLFANRVPTQVGQARRRKLKSKYRGMNKTVSKARLALCDWVFVVTNIPSDMLTIDEAMVLIRVRWQIELLFKLWKSYGQIDKSVSQNPWRQLCECYAKLIGMILQHWLLVISCWQYIDRSLVKAAQTIRAFALNIATALTDLVALEKIVEIIQRCLAHGGRINRSQKNPHTYQLLLALEENA
jgi:hypothetical protein